MTRVIKFRAWDTKANQWVEESALSIGSNGIPMVFEGDRFRLRAQTVILQQFTGLTDKNGKEIFEGDILEVPTRGQAMWICKVEFSDGGFRAVPTIDPEDDFDLIDVVDCPIIGNVHANPELLEVN